MAGRRRKQRRSVKGRPRVATPLTVEALESRGAALLEAGKFREAIAAFKELLGREQRPAWRVSLAEAYAGRAHGLMAKGMFKEAAVIWRNRAEICDGFLAEPPYLQCLLDSGQVEAAGTLIREQFEGMEARGFLPQVRLLCAARALTGEESLLTVFPGEDPLRRDHPAAQAALQAYCEGDDAALDRQLRKIAFRSPYRDFRQIMKALLVLEQAPQAAGELLARVPDESPFQPLVAAVQASQLPASGFLQHYKSLSVAARRFAAALKGWSPQQLKRAQELQQLGSRPVPEKLLRFLLRNQDILGEAYVRESALRILIVYPRGEALCRKSLGHLTRFQRAHVAALDAEVEGDPFEIYDAWLAVCEVLDNPEEHQGPDHALIKALVLRRMARQLLEIRPSDNLLVADLEQALILDPDDRTSYLELIRLYRGRGKLKDARRLLEQALARYPQDIEVLTEAVETALAGKAFKKAAGLARKVLEQDPINPRVRSILVNAHLAHARKQIRQQKWPLARKELAQAADWARADGDRSRVDFVRGLLELDSGDQVAAREYFRTGFERAGGDLAGWFRLLFEAVRLGLDPVRMQKQARLPRPPSKPGREQVLALVPLLTEAVAEDEDDCIAALELLQAPLKRAAGLDFSRAELEQLCETWLRLDQDELRAGYARAALKRWPGTPLFVYHRIMAAFDHLCMLSGKEIRQLETALERAREEGDMRTAHRITDILDDGISFPAPGDYEPDIDAFDPFDDVALPEGGALDELIEMLLQPGGPPEIAEMKQSLGKEGARQLLRELLQGDFDPDRLSDILGIPDDMLGDPPKPKRRKRRGKSAKKNPDQLDLF